MPVSHSKLRQWLISSLASAGLLCATAAHTLEARLTAPDAPNALITQLEAGSLLFDVAQDDSAAPLDIIAAARADYARLLGLLYNAGYYGPSIRILLNGREAATLPPFTRPSAITSAIIEVAPGPRFQFRTARIAPLPPETTLPEGFAPGQPAKADIIRETAQTGIAGWRAIGHAKAKIADQRLVADHAKATLDANLRIAPGPKLRFGALTLEGKTTVRKNRLHKIISLPTGTPFTPDTLEKIAARLRRTGVFRSVNIREAETINPDQSLDIVVDVTDVKPRRVGFGAELQSRDGLSLSAFWMHRNLLGGAERLRVEGEISGLQAQSGGTDYRLATEFIRPATFGADTDLRLALELEQENDPLYFQESLAFDIGLTRILSNTREASLGLHWQTNHVRDAFGTRNFKIFGLPLGLTLDRRDDPLDAHKGLYLETTAMPYIGGGTAVSGLAFDADARLYRPLGERLTAAVRVQIGSVLGPALSTTPPDMLFFSGGGGTVRGQPYQSNYITTGGTNSGGLSFLGLSGELRLRAWENISTVAFYDAGYISETSSFGGTGTWHSGAGIGMRYHTGIGPIRVDLAGPVSGANSGGIQLYVGIGQAF